MSVSNRDLEKLSTYLDGEIPNRERERLETRLQTDAALHEALDKLQRTRAMVRSLPLLRAPRNFYLTPEMVGQKKPTRRAFPVLSFASVLASVLFVLIFLGDLLVIRSPALSPLSAERYSEQIVELAEPSTALPEEFKSQLPEGQADQEFELPVAEEEAASPLVEPSGEMKRLFATIIPTPAEEIESAPREGVIPMEELGIAAEGRVSVTPLPEESRVVFPFRELVRVFEVILVVVAITTGLAALLLNRMGRMNS
jgi:hypothetical protein